MLIWCLPGFSCNHTSENCQTKKWATPCMPRALGFLPLGVSAMARFHSFTRPKESIPTMAWVESLAPGVFLVRARSAGQSYYSPQKKIYKHTRELDQLLLGHGLPGQVLKKKLFWLNGACACPMPMPDLFCGSQCCSPIHTLLHHSWTFIRTCG